MTAPPAIDTATILWRLAVTLLFVLLNGFFVAAEFALVKVRRTRIRALADGGSGRAQVVQTMLDSMGLHLSSCQLGITVASLILGWLAEPAVAQMLLLIAGALGWNIDGALLHGVALGLALTIVTMLHMIIGEQTPKIWAIQRAESLALLTAYPLRIFTLVLSPLIWVINRLSNGLLRLGGVAADEHHEGTYNAEELRTVLGASAQAGYITPRQRQFAENILGFINLEVRHILVPRVDVVELSALCSTEDNIQKLRESTHTRLPLCEDDLDRVIGVIHAKDVLGALADDKTVDLREMARKAPFIPDTQPLGRMIFELQQAKSKCAIVVDDHGTAIGMAFLEDALEEIVGPIQDEFDDEEPAVVRPSADVIEVRGGLPLPEAIVLLGLTGEEENDDTIGGHVTSLLGRLPKEGDQLTLGGYEVTVTQMVNRRVRRLRFERVKEKDREGS